uniref:Uncharacterized protein n=1 Tax=viral metagenome TaxID=1070528 RepID=A0A6M3KDI2_9ZZZZ
MRQRATLGKYVAYRLHEDGISTMAFICVCGEAVAEGTFVHLDEGGSSAEMRCPRCHRYYQIRCSQEV